jgi:hypothetical protein
LDFQSPNVNKISNNSGLVRDIIPGWQLQIGDQVEQRMFYNDACLTCAAAALQGPDNPRHGNYFTFVMASGISANSRDYVTAGVFQSGDISMTTRSLLFQAVGFPSIQSLHVSMNGQPLSLFEFERVGDYSSYGADVTGWAGTTAELRFTVGPGQPPFGESVGLAGIHFSSTALPAIPEPSTWALLITGLAALTWNRRWFWQRRA